MNEIKSKNTVKSLHSQKSKLESDVDALHSELENVSKQIKFKKSLIAKLDTKIKSLENCIGKKTRITEHAKLRYIERVVGLDMEKLENEILNDDVKNFIKTYGDGEFINKNGAIFTIKDNVIITIKKQ